MGCGGSKTATPEAQSRDIRAGQPPPPVNFGDRKDGKPRDGICHICGRTYTVHSINIHIPQCEKKFLAQQQALPKQERKPLPMLPKGVSKMDIQKRNEVAQKLYEDAVMETCPYCERTFMEGRLEKHIKSCARSHGKEYKDPKDKKPAAYPTQQQQHTGPTHQAKNTVICHVCGRSYTTHSIGIHLPQCEKLFLAREEKLPKKERKALPKAPDKNMSLNERNEFATKQYNEKILEACKYCGRTFFPDRLAVHIKSCERNHLKKQKK
jgi:hypothetical protein